MVTANKVKLFDGGFRLEVQRTMLAAILNVPSDEVEMVMDKEQIEYQIPIEVLMESDPEMKRAHDFFQKMEKDLFNKRVQLSKLWGVPLSYVHFKYDGQHVTFTKGDKHWNPYQNS